MSYAAIRLLALVTGMLLLATSVSAGATVLIDFETYPDGSPVSAGTNMTNYYSVWGVTFSSIPPNNAWQDTDIISGLPTSSPDNFLAPGGPEASHGGTLILDFSTPVTEVGSFIIDDQWPVAITAFDANLDIVSTVYSDGSPDGFDTWSISLPAGISRVKLVGGNVLDRQGTPRPDGWGIDDLSYTPIPEPATLLLFFLGGLGILKRQMG